MNDNGASVVIDDNKADHHTSDGIDTDDINLKDDSKADKPRPVFPGNKNCNMEDVNDEKRKGMPFTNTRKSRNSIKIPVEEFKEKRLSSPIRVLARSTTPSSLSGSLSDDASFEGKGYIADCSSESSSDTSLKDIAKESSTTCIDDTKTAKAIFSLVSKKKANDYDTKLPFLLEQDTNLSLLNHKSKAAKKSANNYYELLNNYLSDNRASLAPNNNYDHLLHSKSSSVPDGSNNQNFNDNHITGTLATTDNYKLLMDTCSSFVNHNASHEKQKDEQQEDTAHVNIC